jgi:hypothetical protein
MTVIIDILYPLFIMCLVVIPHMITLSSVTNGYVVFRT